MKLVRSVIGAAALAALYWFALRPHVLHYGATAEDAKRALPGDELVQDSLFVTNRAITIDAPPAEVWPWIAQMGETPRAGYYSFEFVERAMGMQVDNSRRILPEYQHPQVGDAIDRKGTMVVRDVVPGQALVLGPPPGLWLDTTWAIACLPESNGRTRLISRLRARVLRWSPFALAMLLILDPGQLIMERKMLHEIKKRAEGSSDHL